MVPIVDAHLDLAYIAQHGVDLTESSPDRSKFGVNLPALRDGGVRVVFATIFTEWVEATTDGSMAPWAYAGPDDDPRASDAAFEQFDVYADLLDCDSLRFITKGSMIEEMPHALAPLHALLLMEGADPLCEPADLDLWYAMGLRAVGLSWAMGSRHAGGNARPGPLTPLGRQLLDAMHERDMILDVSHLSDAAFDEALDRFEGPVMASHSNARALLTPSERHLRDDHARRLAQRGGVIGLNLYGAFLASGRRATIDDAVRHLDHWRDLVGVEHIGIGSDFDGGFTPMDCPDGLGRPEELPALLDALRRADWTSREVDAVAHGSWMNFLRRSLPG